MGGYHFAPMCLWAKWRTSNCVVGTINLEVARLQLIPLDKRWHFADHQAVGEALTATYGNGEWSTAEQQPLTADEQEVIEAWMTRLWPIDWVPSVAVCCWRPTVYCLKAGELAGMPGFVPT